MIKATYKMAMAAGRDAANRRMNSQGRMKWNRADYNHSAAVVERLIGPAEDNAVSLAVLVANRIVGTEVVRQLRTANG